MCSHLAVEDAFLETASRDPSHFSPTPYRDFNRHLLVKAAGIVREKAGLDRMTDVRREAIHEDDP
jgi:hypothetical protein